MVDTLLIFFFKNTIAISLIFWVLTILGQCFLNRYEYKFKEDFYECGFKTTNDLNFNLNYSFFLSAIFLLLYDVELIFLIPALFNIDVINTYSLLMLIVFLFIVFATLVIDVLSNSIDWNY